MKKIVLLLTIVSFISFSNTSFAQIGIDIEAGLAISGYNDARIPGDNGTLFSFSDELESDNLFFYRIKLNYQLGERHSISALFAPLTIEAKGSFDKDVIFQELTFPLNSNVEGKYTFNSYRLTYRYELYLSENIEFGIGFTGKIRDAEIKLSNDNQETAKEDFGFVPLINFRFHATIYKNLGFLLAGDALAAPQGRAEDILAAFSYGVSDNFKLKLGYRILEGGADNDEVYTFSLINYILLGAIVSF